MDKLSKLKGRNQQAGWDDSALSPYILPVNQVDHQLAVWVNPTGQGWPWVEAARKLRKRFDVGEPAAVAVNFQHYDHAVRLADWMRRQAWWSLPCGVLEGVSPAEVFEHLVRGYAERKVGPVQVAGAIRKMAFTIVGSIQGRANFDDDERSLGGILGGTDSGESQPGGDALPSNGEASGGEDG